MKSQNIAAKILLIVIITIFSGCKKEPNFFTVNQDIEFGQQLQAEIEADPATYPILDETQYPEAYQHLRRIRDALLESDDLKYADRFEWKVTIINDDEVLNAFAAPGGYMFFYTGLIKYLDQESYFAGVMAHEMAHADRRHSTKTMTKVYGYSILLSILLGKDPSKMQEIIRDLALGLGALKFSREHEYEADEYAVRYLDDTKYHSRDIAGFFEQLTDDGKLGGRSPEFLSTHPDPGNRIEAIDKVWKSLGSKNGLKEDYTGSWLEFQTSLPATKKSCSWYNSFYYLKKANHTEK
ncbi:MAG: M48 family metalloprotease [Bacteroidales bacterium]|nr:M48 family metalloprotease [Bacteroidales bacterium]